VRAVYEKPLEHSEQATGPVIAADTHSPVKSGLRLHTKGGFYLPEPYIYRAIEVGGLAPRPYERVAYTSLDATKPGTRLSLRGHAEFEKKFLWIGWGQLEDWTDELIERAMAHLIDEGVANILQNHHATPHLQPLVAALA
jgi:hypothetical protein